jgi:hypothetical protein
VAIRQGEARQDNISQLSSMKKYLFALLLLVFFSKSWGQQLKKYAIGGSGCFAYFYCDPGPFEEKYSEDSSIVYTAQCTASDSTTYGIICVKLTSPIPDLSIAENLLVSYLDYLKKAFEIVSFAGYGRGHRLKGREDTRGIIDYWKDEAKSNWKVKGWTDGKIISVLFANGKNELPETKVNIFLDGMLLKDMVK